MNSVERISLSSCAAQPAGPCALGLVLLSVGLMVASAPSASAQEKKFSGVVVSDLGRDLYGKRYDLKAVAKAFKEMPVSTYKMTNAPVNHNRRSLPGSLPRKQSGGEAKPTAKANFGYKATWKRCDRGQRLCFKFLMPKDGPELPAGTIGLIWSLSRGNASFVTMDGAVYDLPKKILSDYKPGSAPTKPLINVGLDEDNIEKLTKGSGFDGQPHLEKLEAIRDKFEKCAKPFDKVWDRQSNKLSRKNIKRHVMEARQHKINESFRKKVSKKCKRHPLAALGEVSKATEKRNKDRQELYETVKEHLAAQ